MKLKFGDGFESGRIAALFCIISLYLCIWQSIQSWKKTNNDFCRKKNKFVYRNLILHYADQHETFHEFYWMQNETVLVVSISETFEKKGYHQCSVDVYQYFTDVGFNSYRLSIFISLQIWNYSILFQQKRTSSYNKCFHNRTWFFSDTFLYIFRNGIVSLIFQYCFKDQCNISK